MKRKQIFQQIITTMQKELPFPVLEREMELPADAWQIVAVTGVRRCGKSSLMKIVANKLIAEGVDRSRVLWINFDDERLDGMTSADLYEILQAYRDMFPDSDLKQVYMFFDEIQMVEHWELFVLRVYKTYCRNIYLSGSNARMLSSQIATALRGWPVEYEEFPLSFGEYLSFKSVEISPYDEEDCSVALRLSREYLHAGAFPEVVLMQEESLKIRKLQGYFNTMLFRDMVEHYGLSSPEIVRYFLRRLMMNITKPTSINAIYNDIKSQGRKVDKNRLYEVADMACNIFLFYRVNRWSPSLIKETNRLPKYYFIDNGMRNALLMPQIGDDGKLLENAVYLSLRRNIEPFQKITYFDEGVECDFVVQSEEHIDALIQVCYTMEDQATRERELRGLRAAMKATGCKNCYIVTFDEEDETDLDGVAVKIVPAWKWMLRSDNSRLSERK